MFVYEESPPGKPFAGSPENLNDEDSCPDHHDGWLCTRDINHDGLHEAGTGATNEAGEALVVARWGEVDDPQPGVNP